MKIEKVYKNIRYTLSNDDLKVGDKVFPIASGRCTDDGWILHDFKFDNSLTGFPDEPHIIKEINIDNSYKPYEVHTDHGYSPRESYYKIIKMEKQLEIKGFFTTYEWVVI